MSQRVNRPFHHLPCTNIFFLHGLQSVDFSFLAHYLKHIRLQWFLTNSTAGLVSWDRLLKSHLFK